MPPQGRTICVSPTQNPNFSGCPSNNPTDHLATNDFQSVLDMAQANTRILFRRGETWTLNSSSLSNRTGPIQLGAFPNPYQRGGTRVFLNSIGGDWAPFISFGNSQNIYVSGFHATGPWSATYSTAPWLSCKWKYKRTPRRSLRGANQRRVFLLWKYDGLCTFSKHRSLLTRLRRLCHELPATNLLQ